MFHQFPKNKRNVSQRICGHIEKKNSYILLMINFMDD
jgi:uncharacterized protein YozE (UPF0346 family)